MEIERLRGVATIITFPLVDADGDPVTSAGSLDSEIDAWADGTAPNGFADCTNEATEIGTTGQYYLSLTATEMDADYIIVQVKSTGAKTQTILVRTKQIGIIRAGLAQSATASTIVLDSGAALGDDNPNGSVVYIAAGTGAGQSPRVITDYVTSTDTATVSPDWTTTPDSTSVFVLLASPPAPTATSALPGVDVKAWLGTAAATPTVAGVPEVDLTHIAGSAVSTSTAQLGVNAVQAGGTAWGSGAITAASIAADAITDAKVASDVTIASVTGAVGSVTGNVGGNVTGSVGSVAAGGITATSIATGAVDADALAADAVAKIFTTALTEAYAADGVAPTAAQLFFGLQQFLQEKSISGTTLTVKKLDGSTTAMTFTLDSAVTPTSITRST